MLKSKDTVWVQGSWVLSALQMVMYVKMCGTLDSSGTSGLRDSTSQLTSHPLEAQSGSRCTKLRGRRITPIEAIHLRVGVSHLSDCFCRCPHGVIEHRPPSGPRGACASPEHCSDRAVFFLGAELGE